MRRNIAPLRAWTILLAPLLLMLGAESAHADSITAAWVSIFDGTNSENYTIASSLSDSGYVAPGDSGGVGVLAGQFATQAGASAFDVQESPTSLGQASLDFEYSDSNPIALGTAKIVNFNISGPDDPGGLSDTLSITFTGHQDGTNNVSVDLHYLSDNDLGLYPPSLPNAISIEETGQYQDLSAAIKQATAIAGVTPGLANFDLRFTSAVLTPEPTSLILLGIGLVSLAGFRWRELKKFAAAHLNG